MGLKQTWIDKGNGPYIKKAGSRQAGRKTKIIGSIIQRQVKLHATCKPVETKVECFNGKK